MKINSKQKEGECPADNIEDCPWGKENVEFRKILLSSLPDISMIEVVEKKCSSCNGIGSGNACGAWVCSKCNGTGTISRPAEWGDIPEEVWGILLQRWILEMEGKGELAYAKSGGRLRIRND